MKQYVQECINKNCKKCCSKKKLSESPIESILEEATRIISTDRAEDYGDTDDSFENISTGWKVIFKDGIDKRKVGLAMIWLKICRDLNKPKRDNLVDIAGYVGCIDKFKK